MNSSTESVIEQATLAWRGSMDYTILSGPEIAPVRYRLNGIITDRFSWSGGCDMPFSG